MNVKNARRLSPLIRSLVFTTLMMATLFSAPVGTANRAGAQTAQGRDIIILLDTTVSMKGEGGTENIWANVVDHVSRQVSYLSDDYYFAVIPFSDGPRLDIIWPEAVSNNDAPLEMSLSNAETRADAISFLRGLNANGHGTYICASLKYALTKITDWRESQDNKDRIQTVYLYTDGKEEGADCRDNFAESLSKLFNSQSGEYPYLNTVYVDLGGQISNPDKGMIETGGGISVVPGVQDLVSVSNEPIDLGNLYVQPQGVTWPLELTNGATISGTEARTALLNIEQSDPYLAVLPTTINLSQEMTITFKPTDNITPGPHNAVLVLKPVQDDWTFANRFVPVTYSWDPPAPTATIPPTATPIPPTPTPVPPTPAPPTPTATPTPVAGITIDRQDGGDLGTVTAGSDTPLTGTSTLLVTFDDEAVRQNVGVDLQATIDDAKDVQRFWLVDPQSGQPRDGIIVTANGRSSVTIEVGYDIAADNGRFIPGSSENNAIVAVTSGNATIGTFDSGSEADGQFAYIYTVRYPFGPLQVLALVLLFLLVLLALFWKFHARFPKGATVIGGNGQSYPLRGMSEENLRGKLYPNEIEVGMQPGININALSTLGKLTPRFSPLSVVRHATVLVSNGDALQVNGAPIERRIKLNNNDIVTTHTGTFTYRDDQPVRGTQATGDGKPFDGGTPSSTSNSSYFGS